MGSGSWSGVGGVRVGVGRDGVEFVEIQVRGLGSERSEKLGVGVGGVLGRGVKLKSRRSLGLGSRGQGLGSGGWGSGSWGRG